MPLAAQLSRRLAPVAILLAVLVAAARGGPPTATVPASRPTSVFPLPTTRVTFVTDADAHPSKAKTSIELVRIPAGKVTLTDDKGRPTEHAVKAIWVARYEACWPEFYSFAWGYDRTRGDPAVRPGKSNRLNKPEYDPSANWGIDNMPANNIPLRSAKAYCAWLSAKTGKTFRLPTEAEWEYACRAGGPARKLDAKALVDVAWFAANADDQTHPVGQKRPNAWGLYDMLGNVGEQVITASGEETVAGGSYKDDAPDVHPGAREAKAPKWTARDPQVPPENDWYDYGSAHHIGFRVVMEE